MPSSPSAIIPQHVAIIMDGNGRWAKQRHLARIEGHRRGVESVRAVLEGAREMGIRYLTLYAFSAENWRRPADEVSGLMELLAVFLKRETRTLLKNNIQLRTIGRTEGLPEKARAALHRSMEATAGCDGHTLVLALNYGSRTEIADAAAAYAKAVAEGRVGPEASWESFASFLYTADIPDPDLVIRTSGELRLSNFLLMQSAYAEFVFSPVLWPDFRAQQLREAVETYARRERRFGGTTTGADARTGAAAAC